MLLPLHKSLQEHGDYIKTGNDEEKMKYDRGGKKIYQKNKERKKCQTKNIKVKWRKIKTQQQKKKWHRKYLKNILEKKNWNKIERNRMWAKTNVWTKKKKKSCK